MDVATEKSVCRPVITPVDVVLCQVGRMRAWIAGGRHITSGRRLRPGVTPVDTRGRPVTRRRRHHHTHGRVVARSPNQRDYSWTTRGVLMASLVVTTAGRVINSDFGAHYVTRV